MRVSFVNRSWGFFEISTILNQTAQSAVEFSPERGERPSEGEDVEQGDIWPSLPVQAGVLSVPHSLVNFLGLGVVAVRPAAAQSFSSAS